MNAIPPFTELLDRHRGILHKVSSMYADTPVDREDLVQEIAYQLWKSYPSFRGESRTGTWVYRVALNTAMATFRKRRPAITYPDVLPEPGDAPLLAEESPTERLFSAIRQLSEADRALTALFLEDLSHEEIGKVLGITPNHVGVKLHRIKAKLKSLLNP